MFSFNIVEVKEPTVFVTNIFFLTIFFFFILKNESNKNMTATFFIQTHRSQLMTLKLQIERSQ